jgi:hypothetical protein
MQITAGRSDSDMEILIRKIRRGGVISVYGDVPSKSSVVTKSYLSMLHQNRGILDGGKRFEALIWVHVDRNGVPSMLVDFSPLLLLPLSYYYGFLDCDLKDLFRTFGGRIITDLLSEAMQEEGFLPSKKKEEEFIERSREFLRKCKNCLVVIDGLQSRKGWDDLVKYAILPDEPAECCVVVMTDNQTVAGHCVGGNEDLLVHVSEVQEEMVGITPLSDPLHTKQIHACML